MTSFAVEPKMTQIAGNMLSGKPLPEPPMTYLRLEAIESNRKPLILKTCIWKRGLYNVQASVFSRVSLDLKPVLP